MIALPQDKVVLINLHKEMHAIKHGYPLYFSWLKDQLNMLDIDNRTAVDDFKERQGAAQVVEFIITQMDKSQKEVGRLTS